MSYYESPRWSSEILDCSMPVTFDTYSNCSYNCSYCFSQFQRGIGSSKTDYYAKGVKAVNVSKLERLFLEPKDHTFSEYFKNRYVMQWGGLSDQFDEFERKQGATLELLKFFKQIKYPLSISTKGTWWLKDDRYLKILEGTEDFWHFKVSIITLDEAKSELVEGGVDSPAERLDAIKILSNLGNPVTLRLRPFIIGVTTPSYVELIERAAEAGAYSVSTEFLCLEMRTAKKPHTAWHYKRLSRACGFDIMDFQKKHSNGSGYLRLNFLLKQPYFDTIVDLCKKHKLELGISDAHAKTYGTLSSCCGVPEHWKTFKGQLTHGIQLARGNGEVAFDDLPDIEIFKKVEAARAAGFNQGTSRRRAAVRYFSFYDVIQKLWNTPKNKNSPYRYTDKNMLPVRVNEQKNVVYKIKNGRTFDR